jgi:hypothetical protein
MKARKKTASAQKRFSSDERGTTKRGVARTDEYGGSSVKFPSMGSRKPRGILSI